MELPTRHEAWMDNIALEHEVGHALGGNSVYPDKKDCEKNNPCIELSKDDDPIIRCYAQRVYVFDADEFDKWQKSFGGLA